MSTYKNITKHEFESVLCKKYNIFEFPPQCYIFDWIPRSGTWEYHEHEIKEYCYFIPLEQTACFKIYSSISREGNHRDVSRNYGSDAIRIVAAKLDSALQPILGPYPHIKRITGWENNFDKRIAQILTDLGNDMKCYTCKSDMQLKKSSDDQSHFLGCSNYSYCKGKWRNIKILRRI